MKALSCHKKFGLSAAILKYIAVVSMTLDHIGVILFPDLIFLRILGRLAFPIFAFMIAQGYRHTSNRGRYFLSIFGIGVVLQILYYLVSQSLYQSVLITFSLSILLLFFIDLASNKKIDILFLPPVFLFLYFLSERLPGMLRSDFEIDYGFFGIILPALIFLSTNFYIRRVFLSLGLILLSYHIGGIQWYSLLSLIPLSLYNEKRGRGYYKYFFYLYYPLHLAVLYLVNRFFF